MSELGGTLGDQAESVLINIKQPGLYPWGKRERPRGAADIDKESKQDLHYRYLHVAAPRLGLLGIVVFADAAFLEILYALPRRYYKSQDASGSAPPALM